MSERTYEDGTPAAYDGMLGDEKQIPFYDPDGDMIDVAISSGSYVVKPLGSVGGVGIDRSTGEPVYMQITRISHAIRDHLPQIEGMEPIRRGDVVQMVKPLHEDYFDHHQVSIVMAIEDDRANLYYGGWQPIANLVRIGRARYYPDGTPVED